MPSLACSRTRTGNNQPGLNCSHHSPEGQNQCAHARTTEVKKSVVGFSFFTPFPCRPCNKSKHAVEEKTFCFPGVSACRPPPLPSVAVSLFWQPLVGSLAGLLGNVKFMNGLLSLIEHREESQSCALGQRVTKRKKMTTRKRLQ